MVFNLIDCPIRELPKTGRRFSQLKRAVGERGLGKDVTIRDIVTGIKEDKYRWLSGSAYKQILMFLIKDGYIKQKTE